jgi:hypothetical protein
VTIPNPVGAILVAFPVWWVLHPASVIRFHLWFHRGEYCVMPVFSAPAPGAELERYGYEAGISERGGSGRSRRC